MAIHQLELALRAQSPHLEATDPLLVVILGPTASGKTSLSLSIAEKLQGEIVNCDSVAMYRDFDVGTAKPSPAERARVPHHFVDFVDPGDYMTAGEYARQARHELSTIVARDHLPVVVGGTGLYLRALLEGLFPGPQRSEELRVRLRKQVAKRSAGYLHKILARLDPKAAKNIHANDLPKLIRAIEVCLAARQSMTELWQRGRDPLTGFRILRIGLDPDRNLLYERINHRACVMFENGLMEETQRLLEKYGPDVRPLASLGYKQATQFLRGELTRAQALQAAQQAHRNYAKRQMTWFRREPGVNWFKGFGDDAGIESAVLAKVKEARP